MKPRGTKSKSALIHMLVTLGLALGLLAGIAAWQFDLVQKIYLVDDKTILLNGFIILIFFTGVIQLIRAYFHLNREERQVQSFVRNRVESGGLLPAELSPKSLIARRYDAVKNLYDRKVPINHGAIAAIMVAEESLYQSYPKFVNNVLILTGVFGTIVSLIFALIGAGSVLQTAVPGEGMEIMLLGMNTALTTTATAIVCFFLFTYFYQHLTDLQTYVLSRVEEAVLVHIVPEFAFDSEAVSYKTAQLIEELRTVVKKLKVGTEFIQKALADLNRHNQSHLERADTLIARLDSQLNQTRDILMELADVRDVLTEGFRLNKQ